MKGDSGLQKKSAIHVLMVDDECFFLDVSKVILETDYCFTVETASSVKDAYAKMNAKLYDVVVSDYEMPLKDGLTFLEEHVASNSEIPFILFTGKGREEVAIKALNLGASGYVNKHGDPKTVYGELAHCILEAVEKKRQKRLGQILLDTLPCVALLLRSGTREIVASNKAAVAVGAVPGKNCFSTWGQRENPCPWCLAPEVWATNKPQHLEVNALGVVWDAYWVPVEKDLYLHYAFDITKTRKTEKNLQDSETKFRTVADFMYDWEYWIAPDGSLVFVSPSSKRLTGYSAEEFICNPKLLEEIVHKDDRPQVAKLLGSINEAPMHRFYFRIVNRNGETRWISHACQPVFDAQGKFLGRRVSNRDITDRKKAEEQIEVSEKRFRETLNVLMEGYQIIGYDWRYLYLNDAAAKHGRIKKEDLLGKTVMDAYLGIENTPLFSELKRCMTQRVQISMENQFSYPNGESSWFDLSIQPVPEGIFVLSQDITERKKAEEELSKSERRWAATLASIGDAVIATDTSSRITFMNNVAQDLTGWTLKEAMQKPLDQVFHIINERTRKTVENPVSKVLEKGMIVGLANHTILIRRDGMEIPIDDSGAPIRKKTGKKTFGVVLVFRNITERKKAEEEIRSLAKFPSENPNPVMRISKDGDVLYFNDAAKFLLNDSKAENGKNALSQIIQHAKEVMKSGKRKTSEIIYEDSVYLFTFGPVAKAGYTNVYGLEITESKRKDQELMQERKKFEAMTQSIGTGFIVINKNYQIEWANKFTRDRRGNVVGKLCYSSLHNLNHVCPNCGVKKVFKNGASFDAHEYSSIDINGNAYWVELITTPIKDESGKIISITEISVDITEKKNMQAKLEEYSKKLEKIVEERTKQLEETQFRLINAERLAAIGELAGMVGHDLRNPLTGIKNSAYYLRKKGTSISEVQFREMLETIDKCIDRSNKIINDLLDYSREIHLELRESTPKKLVSGTISMIEVPKDIEIINNVSNEDYLKLDLEKMERVFINLIKNAIDAMPNGGSITIGYKQGNGNLEFSFVDTGIGIPEKILGNIFSPLITTKAQGMGFGLAICKRIVEAHGGSITLKTAVNKGTTFWITIPIK